MAEPKVTEIVGLARRRPEFEKPKVRWVPADVASGELAPPCHGADAVSHLAWAIQPGHGEVMERTNVLGSSCVFEAVPMPAPAASSTPPRLVPRRLELSARRHRLPADGVG